MYRYLIWEWTKNEKMQEKKEIENENGDANGTVDTSSTSLISITIFWVLNLCLTKNFGAFILILLLWKYIHSIFSSSVGSIIKWNCIKLVFDIQPFISIYGQLKIREVRFGSKFFLSFLIPFFMPCIRHWMFSFVF